jgi:retinol dehydrogenase-12
VAINAINPGFCHSKLTRSMNGALYVVMATRKMLVAKSTEQGSRTLVHAAASGIESHGKYFHNGVIDE